MTALIGVCDYGVGNLRSVERALTAAGARVAVTASAGVLAETDGLVLPGVGAFGTAADSLEDHGLSRVILDYAGSGRPLLGICLGFQLLFQASEESGGRGGLGLLEGTVTRLGEAAGKVPHMGWNQLRQTRRSPLTAGIADGTHVYFVHSYAARAATPDIMATCDYGGSIAAICAHDNVMGTQFHPEKSGHDG
ncbi:MAG: imidazole glycerol phosphate synthase subunit HisH, partial [Candidatus Dormibacteria bacterium]